MLHTGADLLALYAMYHRTCAQPRQERILSIADEIVVLRNGRVEKQGSRDTVFPHLMHSEMEAVCEGHAGTAAGKEEGTEC